MLQMHSLNYLTNRRAIDPAQGVVDILLARLGQRIHSTWNITSTVHVQTHEPTLRQTALLRQWVDIHLRKLTGSENSARPTLCRAEFVGEADPTRISWATSAS